MTNRLVNVNCDRISMEQLLMALKAQQAALIDTLLDPESMLMDTTFMKIQLDGVQDLIRQCNLKHSYLVNGNQEKPQPGLSEVGITNLDHEIARRARIARDQAVEEKRARLLVQIEQHMNEFNDLAKGDVRLSIRFEDQNVDAAEDSQQ